MSPEETCTRMRNRLLERVAEKRYALETGGLTMGGVTVSTDDRSKALLMGARIQAVADPAATFRWKGNNGWSTLTAAQVVAISDAVAAYVQALFVAESAHAPAIAALVDEDALRAYDVGLGWP